LPAKRNAASELVLFFVISARFSSVVEIRKFQIGRTPLNVRNKKAPGLRRGLF
jgi:hypothetical protein